MVDNSAQMGYKYSRGQRGQTQRSTRTQEGRQMDYTAEDNAALAALAEAAATDAALAAALAETAALDPEAE